MTFYPGQKVVCVDASNNPGRKWVPGAAPAEGAVYTVARVRVRRDSVIKLHLQELQNRISSRMEAGYLSRRFRPAVNPQVEEMRRIVEDVFKKEKVDA
jgi:hypothetical protein